jgi:type I restriction enzyme S subunit
MTGWSECRLASFCKTGTGGTPSRNQLARYYDGGTIPWVKSGELRESVIIQTEEKVTAAALEETSVKLVPAGALLLAMYGATVGRLGVLGIPATTNQAVCHIIPDPKVAETRYLFHALSHQVPGIVARGVGGAQPNISQGIVKDLLIPLPPLDEQQRIAEMLDRAEALRAKRRAALAQLDTLTQSIFLDLFGDPATNPKRWPRARLGELLVDGPQNGLYKPSSDYGSGVPIVRIDAFYDGAVTKLAELRRLRVSDKEQQLYGLRPDDILVNRVNSIEYLGKSALIPPLSEPTVFESNMMRFSVDRKLLEPRYLVEFLQSGFIKSQILTGAKQAVNQASINQQDIKGFQINVPPLALQAEFVRRVSVVEKLKSAQRRSLAELDALFASLQHRAFRGEL